MYVDVPKIEVELSDKEYLFLYGVLEDTLHSLDAFTPPQESQSLIILPSESAATLVPSSHATPSTEPHGTSPPSQNPPNQNTEITLAVKVQVHSAVLLLHQNGHPLATFAINDFSVCFEDGGKEGNEELLLRVNVSVQNFLISDTRADKASHYQYIVAPKNKDLTMLKLSFLEYP